MLNRRVSTPMHMLTLVKNTSVRARRFTVLPAPPREQKMGQVSHLSIAELIRKELRNAGLNPSTVTPMFAENANSPLTITFWHSGQERVVAFFGTISATTLVVYATPAGEEVQDEVADQPFSAWPALRDRIIRGSGNNFSAE